MKLELITEGRKINKKCPECSMFHLNHVMEIGGSDIVIEASRRGVVWKCLNCNAEFKEVE